MHWLLLLADRLYAKVPADHVVKRALIFDANPRVQRIVFICVPHRGSDLATNWIGSFGIGLISLPGKLLNGREHGHAGEGRWH